MRTARALPIFCLVAGIALRSVGLGWGIPPPLAPEATPVRSSYHLDEESFLRGVARIDPAAGSYDVGDLHWGTLQFYLIWGALEAAQRSGFIAVPWRRAFLEWDPSNFQRIYIAARAVSAAAGIVTLWMVFLIGKRLRDADTGLTAAAIVAVSPLHVVNSHFLTSDVTMTMLALAALYFYLVSLEEAATPPIAAGGFFLGLAIAAKYNAAFLAPLWPIRDLLDRRHSWRQKVGGYAAAVAGFALGEPYAFIRPREVLQAVRAAPAIHFSHRTYSSSLAEDAGFKRHLAPRERAPHRLIHHSTALQDQRLPRRDDDRLTVHFPDRQPIVLLSDNDRGVRPSV